MSAHDSSGVEIAPSSMQRLVSIARDAGAEIMRWYGSTEATDKADGSPITAADEAAHASIMKALRSWTPAIPIISEEGDIAPAEERRAWRRFWLVDPLDGTKEFINQNGEFTVNVALIESDEPVLGVVYAPALDRFWFAGRGLGAWRQSADSEAERVYSSRPAPGAALAVVESRSHPSSRLDEFLATVNVGRRVPSGSSIKLCLVADGSADIYPRFGPTMEWDVAAGDCVFRCSGRDEPRHSPLTYNKPDLRNGDFVIGLE